MKCAYCGEELREGSLFCSNCGKAVQIVPDYNVYDEDYLKQVLKEENGGSASASGTERQAARRKKKQIYLVTGILAALVLIAVVSVVLALNVKRQHDSSFEYQLQMAEKAYAEGDIDAAIAYYENALALDKDNIEVRLALASIYYDRRDYDSVMILCQEVMGMDGGSREACERLIAIYEEQKNYDAILALYDIADQSLESLFLPYVVTSPVFELEEGDYEEYQTLELSADGDYEIYYSMDGSDPTLRGERYTMPIELNENQKTYQISAVCMNEKGLYSEVVTKEYRIDIPAPDMPIVTPDGGDFGVETPVTVTIPDGCSAYYTWDGSDPTIYSTKYTGPITIPEGNNVLSVILVDNDTGLVSGIFRGNYIFYYPDEDEGETLPEAGEGAEAEAEAEEE